VVAAFNSAFQENYGAGGFEEGRRVGWPLLRGAASVVIYRDGTADVGRWRDTVPAAGRPVQAVRQNLGLLIDGGRIPPASTPASRCAGGTRCTRSRACRTLARLLKRDVK
jgi:hypothetical protein